MIRALIADDEPLSRRVIHQLLARHADVTVVAECGDGRSAVQQIGRSSPDVVFLDVRMPELNGIDVARALAERPKMLVVFVTAFEQFALPAFDVAAADYLVKPLTQERFDVAMERVRERMPARGTGEGSLVVRIGTREVMLRLDTVDYIEADDVYAAVVSGGRRYLLRTSLDDLEQRLDQAQFCRVHRSYIVRLERVSGLRRADGRLEVDVGGDWLPVSRRRRGMVESRLRSAAI